MVDVEIVYVPTQHAPIRVYLNLTDGATIEDALQRSGLYVQYPEIQGLSVGIFSKMVPRATVLRNGDRIEIYQPLLVDPKDKRRERARKTR
jgi:putative ubiquitin-RnfH superfamily antitoxin RatB of RatAB toxin-antitoxin module